MSEEQLILVAVDESKQAEEALTFYLDALHQKQHKVLFIHVTELPCSMYDDMDASIILESWNSAEEKSKDLFKKFREIAKGKGVSNTDEILKRGINAGHVISQVAKEKGVTAVVMGTRGLGTIRRTILGSVSDFVLHHAHCPVIVCRQ